jgi:hypothetical protein
MPALLNHTIPEVHRASGRIDARALAGVLGLKLPAFARALGRDESTIRKAPDAPSLQPALIPILELVQRLRGLFAGDLRNVRIWLNAPNPGLDGALPMTFLLAARLAVLDALIASTEHDLP